MGAVLPPYYTTEQSNVPNKQIKIKMKTPKKNGGNFISNPSSENFDTYAGLLNRPPSRAMSLSCPNSLSVSFNHQHGQNKQPPLLPLPHVSAIHHHQNQPLLSRSLSSQGFSRKRDMSLTPKKSKPTKREEAKKRSGTQSISEFVISASDNRWGPEPNHLPKHLSVVFTSKVLPEKVSVENMDMFSGSIFNLSPPPSSLPVPKFTLRSKLRCNAEAAGNVDAGATNNLRRLLRLR